VAVVLHGRLGNGRSVMKRGPTLNFIRREGNEMSYVAQNPEEYDGKVVGTGQCVAFVQVASGAPHSSLWKQGKLVKAEAALAPGTAIATFSAGAYTDSLDGTSHAAVFVRQDIDGILVWDQWTGQPVHQRWIRFQGNAPGVRPVNNGDLFCVIE
jgi:hypothetical protein